MYKSLCRIILLVQIVSNCIEAFQIFGLNNKYGTAIFPDHGTLPTHLNGNDNHGKTVLYAGTSGGGGGGKKRRRRRRKKSIESSNADTKSVDSLTTAPATVEKENVVDSSKIEIQSISEENDPIVEISTNADAVKIEKDDSSNTETIDTKSSFKFNRDEAIALGITDADEDDDDDDTIMPFASDLEASPAASPKTKVDLEKGAIALPDLKETVKKKKVLEEKKKKQKQNQVDETKSESKKISRKDTESFKKLLEVEPQADDNKIFFEEEKYGAVSALLAEGAKPFLGIPSNVLQVGHFFGALSFFIMAFIQYPGFPLTNLPTPLRDAFQGGLTATYAINAVLAVLSVFEAPKRGQPLALWVVKTFTLGGLAYDQLTQLPTMEEIQRQKSIKGKRGRRR